MIPRLTPAERREASRRGLLRYKEDLEALFPRKPVADLRPSGLLESESQTKKPGPRK
jgi:hypothetical protein